MDVLEAASRADRDGTRMRRAGPVTARPSSPTLRSWLAAQPVNVNRHAAALRPFGRDEFGSGPAAPTEGHLLAVNELLGTLRSELLRLASTVRAASDRASLQPTTAKLQQLVTTKERAHDWVRTIERIWDFYFELFGQRQSRFASWLLACDRIALDCYQVAYMRCGVAKSIPAPPPFCYMRTGFAPATFRRGIPLRRLGQQLNPFPLIQLPYHRLVNPWTLGAVLHEVMHNLQNELGLARVVPVAIGRRLLDAGIPGSVASVWVRWNRELFADVGGLLLGGPAVVGSLLDVIGRSPASVLSYDPRGPHPTPYLRLLISAELLRRMGFAEEAEDYRRLWTRIYPDPYAGTLPRRLVETFPRANRLVVDAVCYSRFPALGNRSLAEVLPYGPKEQQITEEVAQRLAAGTDPGIVPERFLIGAARVALDNRLARPGVITRNFYTELARR